jgi:hypothetical protein
VPLDPADALPTLQPLDTGAALADAAALTRDLLLVRPSALDLILNVLSIPVERLPERASAVVRFIDADTLEPLPSMQVTARADETVAYDTAQGWTDDAIGTGPRGLTVIANLTALAYPGTDHLLAVAGAAEGNVSIRLAADTVTFLTVAVRP